MNEPHACDEHCVCPVHRTPMTYVPRTGDHACGDAACEYGLGTWRQMAGREQRRADRVSKFCNDQAAEVIAGLSTDAHRIVIEGGLPFCQCGWPLPSGDRDGDFITHAIRVVWAERARAIPDGGRAEVEWAVWLDCGLAKGSPHEDGDHQVVYSGNSRAQAWAIMTPRYSDDLVMVAREVTCGPWTEVKP